MNAIRIRRLQPADAVAVRDLRLEGLRTFPSNFGSAWEEEATQPLSFFENRLKGPARTLGAEIGSTLAGMASVSPNSRVKLAHNVEITGFIVRPAFHRQGVGRALMQSAMELIRSGEFPAQAYFATLAVTSKNEGARRLYESFGFKVCGQLEHELRIDGDFYDELLMRARIS
ncbi:MAG: GNAT family N-acetyltransferase [Micropepsaceae bacterium]